MLNEHLTFGLLYDWQEDSPTIGELREEEKKFNQWIEKKLPTENKLSGIVTERTVDKNYDQ